MNRKNLFTALSCALLVFSMLGCGASNKLKSIQLTATNINGVPTSSQAGTITLHGPGATIQLMATGTYTGGKSQDLTKVVTYNVVVDPSNSDSQNGGLLPPCQPPSCPAGTAPNYTSGTLEYNNTGLLSATSPADCSWANQAVDPSTTPAWAIEGSYVVTATFDGVTSQPFFVPMASATGIYDQYSNPGSACGPS